MRKLLFILLAFCIFSFLAYGQSQSAEQPSASESVANQEQEQQTGQNPAPRSVANQEPSTQTEAPGAQQEVAPQTNVAQPQNPVPSPSNQMSVSGANVTPQGTASNPSKISLDIKGMDIIDVLKMLASRSGMNIVVGKNVTGRVTLFLKDINTWDAFEIIILSNDLAYEKNGEIINVMTQRDYELQYGVRFQDKKQAKIIKLNYAKAADLSRALNQIKTNVGKIVVDEASNTVVIVDSADKLKEMEDFIAKTDLPLKTKIFSLNYAQADKLTPKLAEIITKGVGFVKADERTNKIVVTDYPQKLEEIGKIIAALDEKTPQVLIDAQIIEVRPSDKFEMGVDWDYWLKKHFRFTSSLPINTTNALILSTASTADSPGGYKGIIDLLRTIGDTKVLSSPRVVVLNNQEAKIMTATKDAYITSAVTQTTDNAVTSQTVNFIEVGIKLLVTPTINQDGFITMKIKPEVSSSETKSIVSQDKKTDIPIVTSSEAETTVIVKDGVTIIIGGLQKEQRKKTVKKLPLLGDIPWAGFLFRSTSDELTKSDIVILLTPHLVTGESPYTNFSEIKPKNGAIARMEKGNIVTERITLKPSEQPQTIEQKNKTAPKNEPLAPVEKNTIEPKAKAKTPTKEAEAKPQNEPSAVPGEVLTKPKEEPQAQLDLSLEKYYTSIAAKIEKGLLATQPKGEKGEVEVLFTLSSSGELLGEPIIVRTSNEKLIAAASAAIKQAAPFGSFPESLQKDKCQFKIALYYE